MVSNIYKKFHISIHGASNQNGICILSSPCPRIKLIKHYNDRQQIFVIKAMVIWYQLVTVMDQYALDREENK
uniref:Uncharacterized protein n=1 Tax=Arion vulgaris TaxID=1028688 RepID=A0A0B7BID1_9EUPU